MPKLFPVQCLGQSSYRWSANDQQLKYGSWVTSGTAGGRVMAGRVAGFSATGPPAGAFAGASAAASAAVAMAAGARHRSRAATNRGAREKVLWLLMVRMITMLAAVRMRRLPATDRRRSTIPGAAG